MKDLVVEIDTKYCTKSSNDVKEDDNGRTLCTKNSNYRIQKSMITSFGKQFFTWLGPKTWNQVPDKLKSIDSLT